ncbi:MAG: nicotinate-nicotinamide nucleotide adenylyltransferase [Actinomycetota bacterium]
MRDRIGVLGSLCNPPHVGHVALARAAAAQLELARVLLVPTGAPSHRPAPAEGPDVRWRLAEAAAADEPVFEASRVEVDRPGPSYMADTLLELAPLGELVLLLGSDQYATLDTWHEPALVRARCRIAVAERPGTPLPPGDHETIVMDPIDVSSSEVRRCVAAGEPIGGLVTPSVEALIHGEGLYR